MIRCPSMRVPATLLACAVLAATACESPYRDRGILDKDVAVFIHGFYNATSLPRLPATLALSIDGPELLDIKPPQIAAVGGGALWTINSRLVLWGQASGGVTQYSPSVITNFGFAIAF